MMINFNQNYYRQDEEGLFGEFLSGIEKKGDYLVLYFTTKENNGWQRVFLIDDDLIHMCDVDEGNKWHIFNATDKDIEKIKREVFEEDLL